MIDFLKTSVEKDRASLGRVLTSWIYTPKKSSRFLLYIFGLVGGVLVFAVMYGSHFLPWLKKIPDTFLYLLLLGIGPVLGFFRSLGKTQEWTLYDRGFSVKYINQGKGTGDEKFEYWLDYKTCTYDSHSVTLIPAQPFKRKIKIHTAGNSMEIYSMCRERISIAQAELLHRPTRTPAIPNTPEQRRIAQLEKQYSKRSESNSFEWKDLFKG